MEAEQAEAKFERLTEDYLTEQREAHPVAATALGFCEYAHCLDDFNRFSLRAHRDRVRAYLHAIDKISLADLKPQTRIDYRLVRSSAQTALFELEQNGPERRPDDYLCVLFTGLYQLLIHPSIGRERRAAALLSRLYAVPHALLEAKQNLKSPPRLFTQVAIERADSGDTLFTGALQKFIEALPSGRQAQMLSFALGSARAALADFSRFLKETLLPRSNGSPALGRERYDYFLRVGHLMEERENSAALLCIGLETLETARQELSVLADEIAPGRGWQSLVREIKQSHPTAQTLLSAYGEEMRRAREFLVEKDLVALPDCATPALAETPDFARPLTLCTAYQPPAPFDANGTGILYVTPADPGSTPELQTVILQRHSFCEIASAVARYLYPGDHLQRTAALQNASPIRRHLAGSSLFCNGWAHYGEAMMGEEGFYTDSYARLMQARGQLWQACRLLADVRLHTGACSLEEAAQFFVEEALLDPAHAAAEARWIALNPTEAMTPLVGKRALMRLREEAQRRQGARFSLRNFHDHLLSYGSIPPMMFREILLDASVA